MFPTVVQPVSSERWDLKKEVTLWAQQTRDATNRVAVAEATLTQAGDDTYATIWTSPLLRIGESWDLTVWAKAFDPATGANARHILDLDVQRTDAGVTTIGGSVFLTTRGTAGVLVQAALAGNGVVIQVKDGAVPGMQWRVIVEAR
jgi:hypothetical protein